MRIYLTAVGVLAFDQITKEWVRSRFSLYESVNVIPHFFDFTYIRNTGAAFGMFSGFGLLLALFSVLFLIALLIFWKKVLSDTTLHRIVLGLLCGGILGNVLDRFRLNYVTDFLDFYIGAHHWPAFNVADSAICIAVGLYALSLFLQKRTPPTAIE